MEEGQEKEYRECEFWGARRGGSNFNLEGEDAKSLRDDSIWQFKKLLFLDNKRIQFQNLVVLKNVQTGLFLTAGLGGSPFITNDLDLIVKNFFIIKPKSKNVQNNFIQFNQNLVIRTQD